MAATTTLKGVQREVKCLTFNFHIESSTTGDVATGLSLPAGALVISAHAKVSDEACTGSQNVSIKVGGQLVTGTVASNTHLNVLGEWTHIPIATAAAPQSGGAVAVTLGGALSDGQFDITLCYVM